MVTVPVFYILHKRFLQKLLSYSTSVTIHDFIVLGQCFTNFPAQEPLEYLPLSQGTLRIKKFRPTGQKTKRRLVALGYDSSVANLRAKISAIFRVILEFFAVFHSFYEFIPRFLAEPLTLFCATPVRKHWHTD